MSKTTTLKTKLSLLTVLLLAALDAFWPFQSGPLCRQ